MPHPRQALCTVGALLLIIATILTQTKARSTSSCSCCGFLSNCECSRQECEDFCASTSVDDLTCSEPSWSSWFGGGDVKYSCRCEDTRPSPRPSPSGGSGETLIDTAADAVSEVFNGVNDFVNSPGDSYTYSAGQYNEPDPWAVAGLALITIMVVG
jgi:hypothetical protein